MFHLAVVLEKRHVVGGGLDAQHDAALVVHLDRGFAEAMLHARPLDAGGKLRANLLGQLRGEVFERRRRAVRERNFKPPRLAV